MKIKNETNDMFGGAYIAPSNTLAVMGWDGEMVATL